MFKNQKSNRAKAETVKETTKPSHAVRVIAVERETDKAIYAEIEYEEKKSIHDEEGYWDYEFQTEKSKIWIPKAVLKQGSLEIDEKYDSFIVEKAKAANEAMKNAKPMEVISETEKAMKVRFLDEEIWIPKVSFIENYGKFTEFVESFLLSKFVKLNEKGTYVIKETEKSVILESRVQIPKKFVRSYKADEYIAQFRYEYFKKLAKEPKNQRRLVE